MIQSPHQMDLWRSINRSRVIVRSPSNTNLATMQDVCRAGAICTFVQVPLDSPNSRDLGWAESNLMFERSFGTPLVSARSWKCVSGGGSFPQVFLHGLILSPLLSSPPPLPYGNSLSPDSVLGKLVGEACKVLHFYNAPICFFLCFAHHREIYQLPASHGFRQNLARGSCFPYIVRV